VSLEELAEIAELSKFHFLRQFSQVVGMTPGAYLRTLRLCHAARKLRTTEMPILDVALSVGFADHPSFSRAFARHMGMTPSEYQKLGPL
jgi:transcriptional regulator GlxA family with amidase domain